MGEHLVTSKTTTSGVHTVYSKRNNLYKHGKEFHTTTITSKQNVTPLDLYLDGFQPFF